jgi:uncharacterized protein
VRAGREPERACVGCRAKAPKRELVRIVRVRAGVVEVDPSGSAPGRGAYVHPATSCVQAATRRGALARALRTGLSPEELDRLRNILKGHVEHA